MRIDEFLEYIIVMMLASGLLTVILVVVCGIISLCIMVFTDFNILDFLEDILSLPLVLVVWGIITIATSVLFTPKYSEKEFDNTFTRVNDIVYDDGRIIANGEEFDTDFILASYDVPYSVIIDGVCYVNKGVVGIGLDKIKCRKLIIKESDSGQFIKYVNIKSGNKEMNKSIKKVVEIIEYNNIHGTFSVGSASDKVTQVGMGGVTEAKQDERVVELQNQVNEIKKSEGEKDREIEKLKNELEIGKDIQGNKIESSEEIVLKWVWKILVTLWVMGVLTYMLVKRENKKQAKIDKIS